MSKSASHLDPTINPAKGVKRLNKLPMVLIIGVSALAALIIMVGIISHSYKKQNQAEEEAPMITMDDESVTQLMDAIPEGHIEPSIATANKGTKSSSATQDQVASISPELLERLEKLEAANKKQNDELQKLKAAEQKAVADAPLVVDMREFRKNYETFSESNSAPKKATQLEIAMGQAPADGQLLLPSLNGEDEFVGFEPLSREEQIKAHAAENAYLHRQEDDQFILPYKVQEAVADLELKAGSIINTTLITGINSDLEGNIIAQVNSNIYDSLTGDYLLIPMGARILGSYESENVLGVDRVGIVWNRLIFPNGESLTIGDMRGSDTEGYSGLKDKVNNHYGRIFGSALMLSAVSTSVAVVDDGNNQNFGNKSAAQTAREEVAVNLGRVITEKLRQDINIEPTIEIRPGKKSIVLVTKDMTFEKEYQQHLDYSKLNHPTPKPAKYFDPRDGKRRHVSQKTDSKNADVEIDYGK